MKDRNAVAKISKPNHVSGKEIAIVLCLGKPGIMLLMCTRKD